MSKRRSASRRSGVLTSRWLAPSLFALAGLLAFPASLAEADIASMLAARLNAAAEARETKALVLVAPPRAMGVLRPALSAQAGALVRDVLDKDYVNLPIDRIEKYLAGG